MPYIIVNQKVGLVVEVTPLNSIYNVVSYYTTILLALPYAYNEILYSHHPFIAQKSSKHISFSENHLMKLSGQKFTNRVFVEIGRHCFCKRRKEKNEKIRLSPIAKAPLPSENESQETTNTKTPPKISITKRLRSNCGLSVGVTSVTQLVCSNRFTWSNASH